MTENENPCVAAEDVFSGQERELVRLLREKGWHVSTAESLTGGMISAQITSVPGASEVFECGVCSYSNRIKQELLGVSRELLQKDTEYSAACAAAMAEGVRRLAGAELGISSTGIAGPGGGTPDKPVGTVYVGISTKNNTRAYELHLGAGNDRHKNRVLSAELAVFYALTALREE